MKEDSVFLQWIRDRIVNRYGESELTDFVVRLDKIIEKTKRRENRYTFPVT